MPDERIRQRKIQSGGRGRRQTLQGTGDTRQKVERGLFHTSEGPRSGLGEGAGKGGSLTKEGRKLWSGPPYRKDLAPS